MNYSTKGLTKYIETANIDYKLIRKAESTELKESISKCNVRIRESVGEPASGWWVPISFYEKENANERIYGKRLWENVINNQRDIWVGAPMLVDHPAGDSDGSPKDICGVWLDAKMDPPNYKNEGLVYGLLIPSGHNGEDLKDHLNHGLKVGTSSSGFGKLLSDGHTVDPDSFVIERLSDWVLNPSQGTFFSYEEDVDGSKEITNKSKSINESITHKEVIKEKFVKDSKYTKLEEKKFRRDMESFLEDASNIKDPQERLLEFKEIESYLEDGACPDLREKIEEKIAEEEEYIRTALREKAELKDELQIESPKDLKKKLTKIVEDAAILDKEAKDWKKISETLQDKLTETKTMLNERPTKAYASYLRERNDMLTKDLREKTDKAKTVIKDVTTAYKEASSSNEKLASKVRSLQEDRDTLNEKFNKIVDLLNKYNAAIVDLRENTEKMSTELKEAKETITKLTKENKTAKIACKKVLTERNTFQERVKEQASTIETLNRDKQQNISKKRLQNMKKELQEARENMTDAELYYENLERTYGRDIKPFKERITNALTLVEAKKIFFEEVLQNLPESQRVERLRMPENLSMSPKKRAESMGNNFKKDSIVDRRPEGWL